MEQQEKKVISRALNYRKTQWKRQKSIYMLLFALLLIITPVFSVKAASSLKLYYDKKNVTYTGKQIVYKIDGKQVSKKNYPGIVIGSTSLVSYKDVFVNSNIGITSSYSSSKGTLTLKKDYTTIKFTLGSTTVYVDGKKQTVSQAPRKVTFKSTGVTKILVPARFVAEAFGYTYNYNSSTALATITSPKVTALNLYDFNQKIWFTYRGTQGKVKVDGENISITTLPSILHESTTMIQAKKVFGTAIGAKYTYNKEEKTITLEKDDTTLVMTLDSKVATVNGKKKTLPHAPMKLKNKANGKTYIMVPVSSVAGYLGYDFAWDSSTSTSILTKKAQTDNQTPPEEEKQYVSLQVTDAYKNIYDELKNKNYKTEINSNYSTTATLGDFTKDTQVYSDREVFQLKAYSTFSKVHSYYTTDNSLVIDVEQSTATNNTYTYSNSIINSATVTFNESSQSSKLVLTTNVKQPKYELKLSDDALTLTVIVYYNYIEKLDVDYDYYTDLASVDMLYPPTMNVTSDDTNVYIDFPYTVNSIGNLNYNIKDGYCVKAVASANKDTTTTRITLTKSKNSTYYTSQTDNSISFVFVYPDSDSTDLKIELPSEVSYSEVTTEDLYYKNQFKVIIPGDYVSFFNENPVKNYSSMISKTSVSLSSSGNTEILVTTLTLQGFRLSEGSSYIGVEIGDPQDIYDKIVVLDAGHGGSDTGAIGSGVYEKTLTYNILYKYAKNYFNSSASTVKAYWTRYNDSYVTLDDRAAFAEKIGADLFISLHMNSHTTSSPNGTETYYSTMNNKTLSNGLNSAKLASIFQKGIVNSFGFTDRKVKTANYAVIKKNTVPAILIELGFISNSSDLKKMNSSTNQKKYAEKIYQLTEEVFEQYPTGR